MDSSDALTAERKDQIQGAYRSWLEARGFRPRRGQREMIAQVARSFGGAAPRIAVIEAGTGTGKTAAYCLAAIPLAQALGKRVVISTATVALQEQVVFRDLPDLRDHANLDFSLTLAKGRGRYVCLKRLDDRLRGDGQAQLSLAELPGPEAVQAYEQMFDRFGAGKWNGEIDSWDEGVEPAAWSAVTTDHRGCTNNRCTFFQECPFFRARRTVEDADVIVANHDLVLADLALGGGVVLPETEETIFILDEAHHFPDRAQQHFTDRARLRGATQWLEQAGTVAGTCAQRFGRPGELVRLAAALTPELETAGALVAQVEGIARQFEFRSHGGRPCPLPVRHGPSPGRIGGAMRGARGLSRYRGGSPGDTARLPGRGVGGRTTLGARRAGRGLAGRGGSAGGPGRIRRAGLPRLRAGGDARR